MDSIAAGMQGRGEVVTKIFLSAGMVERFVLKGWRGETSPL